MALSDNTMEIINTAIEAYLGDKKKQAELFKANPDDFVPKATTLSHSLNTVDIDYAEEELRRTNQTIILAKIPYGAYCKIYYYKHPEGNFTVVLDNNDNLVSVN